MAAACRALAETASGHGVSVHAVAIAEALADPWFHVVLSGTVTGIQISNQVDALATLASRMACAGSRRQSSPWR